MILLGRLTGRLGYSGWFLVADKKWISTGEAARLCSVAPDTVQKWIRSRRLAAQRTAGGHYRIDIQDIGPFATRVESRRWFAAPPRRCAPQPLRCWEYLSDTGEVKSECLGCVVYRVRAAWCFDVLGSNGGAGHSRTFCTVQGGCSECAYYKRVCGLATSVLVITADRALRAVLESEACDSVVVHFARDGYEASALIAAVRPAFAVVDSRGPDGLNETIIEHLMSDRRAPGLRVVVFGNSPSRAQGHSPRVFGITKTSLQLRDIVALIESVPVERKVVVVPRPDQPPNQ